MAAAGTGAVVPGMHTDPDVMYRNYEIRMGDSWIMSDNTYDRQPMNRRRKLDVPYPQMINHTYRAMNGLNSLQISHDAPVTLPALDVACDHAMKCLHDNVRCTILVAPPNGPSLWSGVQADIDQMYTLIADPKYRNRDTKEYLFYSEMKSVPWIIWPLWVEDDFGSDYVTVALYSESVDREGQKPLFTQLLHYTIIDPRRARYGTKGSNEPDGAPLRCDFPHTRTRRVELALRRFLRAAGYDLSLVPMRCPQTGNAVADPAAGETVVSPMTVVNCSPMPAEERTSGERCFATVKELLERIVVWWGQKPRQPLCVFRDLRSWINPYQFRIEMAGINAWILMATLDYDARICVEVIPPLLYDVAANGRIKQILPYDLAGPFIQPPPAPADWLLPGQPPPAPPAHPTVPPAGGAGGGGR